MHLLPSPSHVQAVHALVHASHLVGSQSSVGVVWTRAVQPQAGRAMGWLTIASRVPLFSPHRFYRPHHPWYCPPFEPFGLGARSPFPTFRAAMLTFRTFRTAFAPTILAVFLPTFFHTVPSVMIARRPTLIVDRIIVVMLFLVFFLLLFQFAVLVRCALFVFGGFLSGSGEIAKLQKGLSTNSGSSAQFRNVLEFRSIPLLQLQVF